MHVFFFSNEHVIQHAETETAAFLDFIKHEAVGQTDVERYIDQRQELFAYRLLERRAMAQEPMARAVYNVSWVPSGVG